MPDAWKKNHRAGVDWARAFMRRNSSLSMRSPLNRTLSRAVSFNEHTVKIFFDNLESIFKKYPQFADGRRIFNLDETSTTKVLTRQKKVIAEKGSKEVTQIVSQERGILVTTTCIIAANGTFLPPAMVMPRVNFKPWMIRGAPTGTLGLAYKSGWMTSENFVKVMEHFVEKSGESKENPALLIFDNAECHLSIEAVDIAKKNGVVLLTLPPHSSQKLQPLDKAVYSSFKTYYDEALNNFMMLNPGKTISIYDIPGCVSYAFDLAMNPTNIKSGFSATGIFPFNRNLFQQSDFLQAQVTSISSHQAEQNLPSPPTENLSSTTPASSSSAHTSTPGQRISITTPSSSTSNASVLSLADVLPPYPQRDHSQIQNRRGRKRGRSFIPTNTPEKLALEASKKGKKPCKSQRK